MNQISDPAREYSFGTTFNYAQWTPDTVVTLANVPWNNDYRDIVRFATTAELNEYIDSMATQNVRIPKMSHVKPSTGVIRVSTPFNLVMEYNYLRASNPIQPVPNDKQRDYFYFILDVKYISPQTTEIVIQLDIWQSFGRGIQFGSAFVERGHIGCANENQFDAFGRDYLTVPEGHELGTDYRIIATRRNQISNVFRNMEAVNGEPVRNILVTSNVNLTAPEGFGTIDDPKMPVPIGGAMQGQMSGAGIYVWETVAKFRNWLRLMKDISWVVQGIMSITIVPTMRRWNPNYPYGEGDQPADASSEYLFPIRNAMYPNWRSDPALLADIDPRYRRFLKLFTFPYMAIEMTTWSANPLMLRPEVWADRSAHVLEKVNFIEPNQRMTFHPQRYGSKVDAPIADAYPAIREIDPTGIAYHGEDGDDGGEYLDIQTSISSFPKLAILSNSGTSALAANAHSLHQARESADWSQERAGRAASLANSQANNATRAANETSGVAQDAAHTQQGIANRTRAAQAVLGGVGGAASGAGTGAFAGPAGALAGGVGGAVSGALGGIGAIIDINAADESVAAANVSRTDARAIAANQESFVSNSNKNLAMWASRGDYAQTIAGIDAKVQDLKMLPASVSGQVGGDMMNFIHDNVENVLRWKMVDNATIRRIGEQWLRYGYAVHARIKIPNTAMVMTKFTYWKLQELYIGQSRMPESFKQTIRGIFEKGVTVWASPYDLANPNFDFADNEPLPGVRY